MLDVSFPHRYRAEAKGWLETAADYIFFPARPGLTIEVTPKGGKAWTGVFGEDHLGFVTGLYTTPDDNTVCVASSGAGYLVPATEPQSWASVDCIPVRFVLPFPQHGLLVFGNFTEFTAYRFNAEEIDVRLEVAWRSARLGWDDLDVRQVTEDRIEGQAWHAPDDRMVGYSVDVRTGEHEGGAYPPDWEQGAVE